MKLDFCWWDSRRSPAVGDVSPFGTTLLPSPELVDLLGHLVEQRDIRCLRFWEMDRWRFLVEDLAAMVTTQGCLTAWSAVRRAAGSKRSRRWIKSLARLETEDQGWGKEQRKAGQTWWRTQSVCNAIIDHSRSTCFTFFIYFRNDHCVTCEYSSCEDDAAYQSNQLTDGEWCSAVQKGPDRGKNGACEGNQQMLLYFHQDEQF